MATESNDITRQTQDLSLSKKRATPKKVSRWDRLHRTSHALVESANSVVAKIQDIQPVTGKDSETAGHDVASLASLAGQLDNLTKILQETKECLQNEAFTHILSLGSGDKAVYKLLRHFKDAIKAIIVGAFDTATNPSATRSSIIEECYKRAIDPSGDLNCLNLSESFLATLHINTSSRPAESEWERCGHTWHTAHDVWIKFWARQLARLPNGPTLFAQVADGFTLPTIPRYLFRAYDRKSYGKNDEDFIASGAAKFDLPCSRDDLLSMERKVTAERLYHHLDWQTDIFSAQGAANNLVSWTSSFLFVVQYAIYRSRQPNASAVYICAVDTTKFPNGQFVRDKWLIDRLDRTTDDPRPLDKFVHLRSGGYDNGDYLTQGTVLLANRSCTFTLENLTTAGLYNLYPELGEVDDARIWTKRVIYLRPEWSKPRLTTSEDIDAALRIARTCFSTFSLSEIALLILTLQYRKVESYDESQVKQDWPQELKPLEVQRFHAALNTESWTKLSGKTNDDRFKLFYILKSQVGQQPSKPLRRTRFIEDE